MKTTIYILLVTITCFVTIVAIIQGVFLIVGPDYKEGRYTMVYRVYYPGNPKEYTIVNEWPIGISSYRGTNTVEKTVSSKPFKKMYRSETVFRTSAPIEVVSYTYTETK